jgi:hypothetical protein
MESQRDSEATGENRLSQVNMRRKIKKKFQKSLQEVTLERKGKETNGIKKDEPNGVGVQK